MLQILLEYTILYTVHTFSKGDDAGSLVGNQKEPPKQLTLEDQSHGEKLGPRFICYTIKHHCDLN